MLDRCLPDDATAFIESATLLCSFRAGEPCGPVSQTWLFLAQGIKWPPVVRHLPTELRRILGLDEIEDVASIDAFLAMQAVQVVDVLIQLLRCTHERCKGWGAMMRTMNSGTMWSQSGLVYLCKSMSLLTPV